uniref:Uncharacterized protein n=1 Tax=Romanomermis culicivorax TaxID=13658 RepID=A0A915ISG0_ROMCU
MILLREKNANIYEDYHSIPASPECALKSRPDSAKNSCRMIINNRPFTFDPIEPGLNSGWKIQQAISYVETPLSFIQCSKSSKLNPIDQSKSFGLDSIKKLFPVCISRAFNSSSHFYDIEKNQHQTVQDKTHFGAEGELPPSPSEYGPALAAFDSEYGRISFYIATKQRTISKKKSYREYSTSRHEQIYNTYH